MGERAGRVQAPGMGRPPSQKLWASADPKAQHVLLSKNFCSLSPASSPSWRLLGGAQSSNP